MQKAYRFVMLCHEYIDFHCDKENDTGNWSLTTGISDLFLKFAFYNGRTYLYKGGILYKIAKNY